jgi:hypothetical protein
VKESTAAESIARSRENEAALARREENSALFDSFTTGERQDCLVSGLATMDSKLVATMAGKSAESSALLRRIIVAHAREKGCPRQPQLIVGSSSDVPIK